MVGHGRRISLLLPLLLLALPSSVAQQDGGGNGDPTSAFSFGYSMIILIAVLGSSFVVVSVFSFYLHYYAGATAGVGLHDFWLQQQEEVGLGPDVLATFPTMVYAEVKGLRIGGKQELECAVCLSEFEDADTLRLLPACSHAFHVDCIDPWLASHTTCPVCRTNLAAAENGYDPPGRTGDVDNNLANGDAHSPGSEQRNFYRAAPLPLHVAIEMESKEEEGAEQGLQNVSELIRHSAADDPHKLRLPEEVLREIFTRRNLARSASFHVDTREQSRRLGEYSYSWSDILTRTLSSRFDSLKMEKREEGESSMER